MFKNFRDTRMYFEPRVINNLTLIMSDGFLQNESSLFLKSLKIGALFRTFCIFRIKKVIFYHDDGQEEDRQVIKDIVSYLNRAPYLRKYVGKKQNLKFSAAIPPVQTASHVGTRSGSTLFKEAAILSREIDRNHLKSLIVDTGERTAKIHLNDEDKYSSKLTEDDLIIISIDDQNHLGIVDSVPFYWKTEFEFGKKPLGEIFSRFSSEQYHNIFATAYGDVITYSNLKKKLKSAENRDLIIYFGPIKGSFRDFINKSKMTVGRNCSFVNFIPDQGTMTVRIEEAIHSVLTLLNLV